MDSIYNYTKEMLINYMVSLNEKTYRTDQIIEWLYRNKVSSFDDMTNISKKFIEKLKADFMIDELKLVTKQESYDGTKKFLFELSDGNLIESVLMTYEYGYSICVTSEVGCNMGCAFCASGMRKKLRNLSTSEMVLQILMVEKLENLKIGNVVIMGIGEPFDNYDNVINFIKIINYAKGLEIGARHITVSTCGIVPKIYEFANLDLQINLAISLHSAKNEVRNEIMPINKSYNLDLLIKAIKDYIDKTTKRVTIEYILLKDVNDSKDDALTLAKLLKGLNVYVNLIPYNEVKEKPYKRSNKEQMHIFFDTLKKENINVQLRKEQGSDIDAACGQLRSKNLK